MPEQAILVAIEAGSSLSSTAGHNEHASPHRTIASAQPDDSSDGVLSKLRRNRPTARQMDDNSPISVIINDDDAPEASTRFSV